MYFTTCTFLHIFKLKLEHLSEQCRLIYTLLPSQRQEVHPLNPKAYCNFSMKPCFSNNPNPHPFVGEESPLPSPILKLQTELIFINRGCNTSYGSIQYGLLMCWKFGLVSLIFGCTTSNLMCPCILSFCGELIPTPSLN